jgi:hypothetical protein
MCTWHDFYFTLAFKKREGSVQLTSLYQLVKISSFLNWKYYIRFYKTSYLNEEVNCTEPSPSVSIPWLFSRPWCLILPLFERYLLTPSLAQWLTFES